MMEPPTVFEVLGKLKGNEARGKNGILPEIAKSCRGELKEYVVVDLALCKCLVRWFTS